MGALICMYTRALVSLRPWVRTCVYTHLCLTIGGRKAPHPPPQNKISWVCSLSSVWMVHYLLPLIKDWTQRLAQRSKGKELYAARHRGPLFNITESSGRTKEKVGGTCRRQYANEVHCGDFVSRACAVLDCFSERGNVLSAPRAGSSPCMDTKYKNILLSLFEVVFFPEYQLLHGVNENIFWYH